jgi:hypothetical protein
MPAPPNVKTVPGPTGSAFVNTSAGVADDISTGIVEIHGWTDKGRRR